MSTPPSRLIIVGLDGATFDLIEPWAAAGALPTLRRLMAEGAWGRLRSVLHPFTAQAWTSMVTGVQQGKHRIFDFWERDFTTYGFRLVNASHRAFPALWNLLSRQGLEALVVNVPHTYPPEPIRGVMVSGRDTPGLDAAYTHPPELKAELDRVSRTPYVIVPDDWMWMQRGRPDRAREELLREVEVRFDVAMHLMRTRPWRLAFFVTSAPDGAAHFFWKYHDPAHPLHDPAEAARYGETLREVYQACDRRLAEVLDYAASLGDCHVLVVSDHGQGPMGPVAIHLNLWLEQAGLLRFHGADERRSASEQATALAARAVQRARRLVHGRIPFQTLAKLRRLWPDSLRARLGAETFFPGVDWSRTRAFSEELRGNIWINLAGRDPQGIVQPGAEYEALRDRIVAELPSLTDPLTGSRPIRRVWRREELYAGPFLERLPDLVVEAEYPDMFKQRGTYRGPSPVRHLSRQELAQRPISGCHRQDGIFLAWGPLVQPGSRVQGANLVDVAPTALHLLGLPAPAEMDGRALVEALQPAAQAVETTPLAELGFQAAGAAVDYSDAEAAQVRERLAGLGYLG